MNVRKIRLKSRRLRDNGDHYLYHPIPQDSNPQLIIPKDQVFSVSEKILFNSNSNTKSAWSVMVIDTHFFDDIDRLTVLSTLQENRHAFVYGRKRFQIDWDRVVHKVLSRSWNICFYCDDPLTRKNKTMDHIVPRLIMKAYGLLAIDDNTVPCCLDCNREKDSLPASIFRERIKTMLKARSGVNKHKWRKALKTLNQILIDPKDTFI